MPTPATTRKRRDLQTYIERAASHEPSVQAVLVIGSVALGTARPDSDIDALVFMDPLDHYALPAEAVWDPDDNTFHSIFAPGFDDGSEIQLDFQRLDLQLLLDPSTTWPEPRRAEFAQGWLAYDRDDAVGKVIAQRAVYDDAMRQKTLDDAITWLDQLLSEGKPERCWDVHGPLIAMDRLQAAYDHLVAALFALNRTWRPWRNREMSTLLALDWLPAEIDERLLLALNAPGLDRAGYDHRVTAIRGLMSEIIAQLVALGDYGQDPSSEAFVRSHDEPGRAWNMDEWNVRHRARGLGHG